MTKQYDNANTGALFTNGGDKLAAIPTGTWENGANAKYRLALGPDTAGERVIIVLSKQGGVVSKGSVSAVQGKGPAYRGTLGKQSVVLWDMGSYYQVRIDRGVPQATLSAEAAALLGIAPTPQVAEDAPFETVGAELDLTGPF